MARHFTREQLNRAARERLDGDDDDYVMPMTPRPAGTEVVRVGNTYRLRETIPAHLEVTQLREPGPAPFKVYVVDDWDSDFAPVTGTPFDTWGEAEAVAKSIPAGYRALVDNAEGHKVLRVVHHPAVTRMR